MKRHPELYPGRLRQTNIGLIKSILYANSKDAHDQALRSFEDHLHPSLFAELDWMEMSVPEDRRDNAMKMNDGLFLNSLGRIIVLRRSEYDVDDGDLFDEVLENRDFYRYVLETEPAIADAFGPGLRERINAAYAAASSGATLKNPDRHRPKIRHAEEKLESMQDRRNLPLLLHELISNEIAESLDHISSRMRAKAFIRSLGGQLPILSGRSGEEQLRKQREEVGAWHAKAKEFSLPSLVEITATALRFLDERDVLSRNSFEGERATGYGNCGECSMMFASSVITSLDTTCPFLFEDGKNRVHLPLQFNIAACPFCGARKRVDAPSMFYRPSNHKVIYCVPTMGQYSEEKAEEIHGEVISALREGYKGRISPEEAEAFDAAGRK